LETKRDSAVIRLHWFKDIPGNLDFCLFNKGIYRGLPTIWNLPPGLVEETKCFFQGDDYCEYHLKWQKKSFFKESFLRLLVPWSLLKTTIDELEQDKELLKKKFNEIHQLNLQLKEKVNQLLCLQETSTAALSVLNLERLLQVTLRLLINFTRLDRACILLLDEKEQSLKLQYAAGVEPELFEKVRGYQVPLSKIDNLIAQVAMNGIPVEVPDVVTSRLNQANLLIQVFQPKNCIAAPLTVRGKVIGVILADRIHQEGAVTPEDKEFFISFANQMAIALENAVLYRKLEVSERKYRELVENAHEGIWVVEESGTISFANRRMREITGDDHLEGKNLSDFCAPNHQELLEKVLTQNRSGRVAQEELELTSHQRGPVSVMMSSVPLMENGKFLGAFAMFSDITEKKKMEKQLLQQQKMEAIGTLAGGIAHNFNNILMNIMGLTGLILANTDAGDHSHPDLKQIEHEVIKGSDLTKQLLSCGHSGKFAPQPLNLNVLVERTAKLFSRTRMEITISKNLAPHLPPVEVDQGQMEQVLMNLFVNAWQAMSGEGEMALSTREVVLSAEFCQPYALQPGAYVHLSLADSGIGMEEQTAARIFEPFFTTKEMSQGTGLGLATAYAIIKNHQGIIRVQSERGRGSTFHIYLPVSEKPVLQEKADGFQFTKGSGTVLLVDDEESIRSVGKRILEQLGYQILLAENGARAVSLYQTQKDLIDLVILDMIMPGMGGGETYRKIRQINPEVKVLLSSGYSIDGEAQKILDEGAQGFIQKPYRIDALSQKIAEMLG
jgi:PAS domain S-box-containing protein